MEVPSRRPERMRELVMDVCVSTMVSLILGDCFCDALLPASWGPGCLKLARAPKTSEWELRLELRLKYTNRAPSQLHVCTFTSC